MARRRFIHPDFFQDEKLVTMPPFTRLLFVGLWCLADRDGRLEDKPLKIKMQVFPADPVDVDSAIVTLAEAGMVTRYAAEGRKYLQVNHFSDYQNPHPNERSSDIPAQTGTNGTHVDANGTRPDANGTRADTYFAGYSGSSDTQGLQTLRAQGEPPTATVNELTKPLGYRPRIDVAWPGRPPVPGSLHAELRAKLGGDPDEADRRLRAWYPTAAAPYENQPIGDDDFRFWRARFREWVGSTVKTGPDAEPRVSDEAILADLEARRALRQRRPA